MMCECATGPTPGFVHALIVKPDGTVDLAYRKIPCPDCGGTLRRHCCEGDQASPQQDT